MLTEGPSRGGRNCSWSSVQSAREYGLQFDGRHLRKHDQYIRRLMRNRQRQQWTEYVCRLEERKDKKPRKRRAKKKPAAS
jgi:hypothetical protein